MKASAEAHPEVHEKILNLKLAQPFLLLLYMFRVVLVSLLLLLPLLMLLLLLLSLLLVQLKCAVFR